MKRKAVTISILQLLEIFPDEGASVEWFEKTRWPEGPICPHCGGVENITKSKTAKHQYWHKDCRKRFTAKTDTIMHASPIEVRKWLVAMYHVMTDRKGISSLELSKQLGITQKSAWYMLQRIREACSDNGIKLSSMVEMDATYLGGKRKNMSNRKRKEMAEKHPGRGTVGKMPVVGMRARNGRTKAVAVDKENKKTVKKLAKGNIEKGSVVFTDEARAYRSVSKAGFEHRKVNHSAKEFVNGMAHTNGIESVWALLKRGYTGTYHHFSLKHLQRYLNEFTFRLNEGNVDIDTVDRMAAICKASHGKRLPYRELVA